MVYKKFKFLSWVLVLVMCATFAISALLPEGKRVDISADSSKEFSLSEDDSLGFADTSAAFDKSNVVNVNANVQGKHWMIVSLKGESLSETHGSSLQEYAKSARGKREADKLLSKQAKFLSALRGEGIPFEYKYGYTLLANAVAIKADVKYANRISGMDGVKSVNISEYYYAPKDSAVTNDANVWGTGIYKVDEEIAAEYNGRGMVVAVLDTGLDASHKAFLTNPSDKEALLTKDDVGARVFDGARSGVQAKNSSVTVNDVYYSEKVPFAYDYADNDADVYPSYSAHGTHVAGIIAGSPILDDNGEQETIKDQDGNEILDKNGNPMTFTGVAPQAQLAICKVFTDSETKETLGGAETADILAALEDCVKLGVDVVNMSLGSSAGFSTGDDEYMQTVYDSVREAGISLVVAASNDYSSNYGGAYGTNLSGNPDSATVGSPSTYAGALSVASINGQQAKYIRVNVAGNDKYLYYTEASDGNGNQKDFIAELKAKHPELVNSQTGDIKLDYVVVPGYGLSVNYTRNIDVKGKIAVVRRGGNVTFEEKVRVAKLKGAIACVIYNNVSGIIRMSLGNLNDPIPTCSITMDAANNFVSFQKGTMYVNESQKAGPFMSDFSSWGPTPDLKLKPEISAHGGEITSTVPNGWAEYSGTSMASPNMAGAMSLILSYVKQNVSYDQNNTDRDAVAMSNFLVMSTATIARDEADQPYSPRKQGAGLADIKKAMSTKAYLYVDKGDKAKIEVGDDPEKTGEYTLKFRVKNMSDAQRTYTLGTKTMTETIASDGMTVAERAYMLDNMSDISFKGKGVTGDKLVLAAGADVEIAVQINLGASAKAYIDKNFENGMYVEGFVTLTDTSTDTPVDLNIPWLGFYGDWYAAPMFDISEYELSEALQDDSIPDDEKPQAAIYPTVPLGSYNENKYIIPLGTYLYEQEAGVRQIYSSSDKAAISIYDTKGHRTVSQLYAIYAGLLRGAEYMNISITDAVTGEVVFQKTDKNVRKAYTGGSSTARAAVVELEWSAKELGLDNNKQYVFHMDGKLASMENRPYDASQYAYGKSFDFNFYVDTEAPEIVDYRVRYEPYKDESEKIRYSVYLDVDVYDNHYAQSIALCFADYSTMTLELLDANMTPIYSEKNSTTTVTLDITDYYDQNVDLYLQVDDYALNARAYRINNFKSLADAVNYPESIEIVSGEDATGEGYSKAVTIGVNEAYKLETLIAPADATSVNLYWSSDDENVVRVKDGELFGVGPGTALVRVYGGKNEYASASDGILVTVSDEVKSEPGVNKMELGLIQNTDDNLVNPTNAVVKVHPNESFRLRATLEPWYTSVPPVIEWESSVPEVASIGKDTGYVKTLSEGSTVIKGTLMINGKPSLYSVSTTLAVGPEFVVQNGYLREYHGAGGKVTIPKSLNVYYIYEEAFRDNVNITELEISAPCTEIQPLAFANMKSLKRVVFPETIEFVYRNAFYGCSKLEQIDLHSRAISFGAQCFANCVSLKRINNVQLLNGLKKEDVQILDLKEGVDFKRIPAHMASIGDEAFAGCSGLEELDITGLRVAGQGAFYNCIGLKKVTLSRFTAISDDMFLNCKNLTQLVYTDLTPDQIDVITYPNKVSPFGNCNIREITFLGGGDAFVMEEVNGVSAIYRGEDKKTLIRVGQNAVSFTVPASVEVIAANAFSGNSKLSSVNFAESGNLKEIGAYAFSGTGLTSVKLPATLEKLGKGAFSWCEFMTSADLSVFRGALPEQAFYNAALQQVSFGANITEIGAQCFAYTELGDVDLSATNVSALGDGAFENCEKLVGVKLGRIVSMGDGVFAVHGSGALVSVSFAMGSSALGTNTFSRQAVLRLLELPESMKALTEIGNGVFRGCRALEGVPFVPVSVGDSAFENCTSLKNIDLSALKTAGDAAFKNCSVFAAGDLSQLQIIGKEAFYGCVKSLSFDLPSVTAVGARAFEASGVKSLDFPNIKTMGDYAFFNTAIAGANGTLSIPSGIEKIGEGALGGLTFITAFSMGEHDKYFVENGVLYERVPNGVQILACPAGKTGKVVLNDRTVRVAASSFENATRITSVEFPYVFKAVGNRAFFNCGAGEYVFGCLKAPVLEAKPLTADDFAAGSEMYRILDDAGSIASEKFYANFKDYVALVLFAGKNGIVGKDDLQLKLVCPENATGFDGRIYAAYFSDRRTSEIIADDNARSALALIGQLPSAETVLALDKSDAAAWKEYRSAAAAAREALNLVSATQSRFVTNAETLYQVEEAMRERAADFGETVTRKSISVGKEATKMSYLRGEKFDPAGMVLVLIWSDGSREEITKGYSIVGGDKPLTLNNRTVTIQYEGLSTVLNVTVNKPAIESIAVETLPAEQDYRPGDTYVSAGLVIKINYVDGISELLYTGYTVEADLLKAGENVITVSYGGKTITYKVTVEEKDDDVDPEPEPNGCASAIAFASVVPAGLLLAAALFIIRKKKNS